MKRPEPPSLPSFAKGQELATITMWLHSAIMAMSREGPMHVLEHLFMDVPGLREWHAKYREWLKACREAETLHEDRERINARLRELGCV